MGSGSNPPARELVPGDLIRLRLGDIVPADARLLTATPLRWIRSTLTGESLPATRKSARPCSPARSFARRGRCARLYHGRKYLLREDGATGQEAHTVSHFQKAVLKIGNYLIILAGVLVAAVIAVAILRGDPILTTLQFALVLTVRRFLWRCRRSSR